MPAIRCALTSRRRGVNDVEIVAKNAVAASRPCRGTILQQGIGCGLGPAARANQPAMSLAGVFSDDIDYSVYCISAPYGAAWSADYFDAIDVLQWHVLLVPENAGKGVRIHAATVDHDQNLVRISSVRAADADGPVVGIDLGY